ELDTAFAGLIDAEINELILDLRYNGGGLVDVATFLASLLVGPNEAGEVFARLEFHTSQSALDEDLTFFSEFNALDLDRLFVLTTGGTASASEMIISGLEPYIEVITMGETTFGKPVGQIGIPFCGKVLFPVAFEVSNAVDFGGYYDGLAPHCELEDDLGHALGDTNEGLLAEALQFMDSGLCSSSILDRSAKSSVPSYMSQPLPKFSWQPWLSVW
ncbi:MAG: peptidase, partial [Gammaproteobacteria bacterium]|nr:peptidase [Gammaproteobacteria bacterium]